MSPESRKLLSRSIDILSSGEIDENSFKLLKSLSIRDKDVFIESFFKHFLEKPQAHDKCEVVLGALDELDRWSSAQRLTIFERLNPEAAERRMERQRLEQERVAQIRRDKSILEQDRKRLKEEERIARQKYLNSPEVKERRRIEKSQEEERRRIEKLQEKLSKKVSDICRTTRQDISVISLDQPRKQDVELATLWAGNDGRDSTLARMISARLAEVAVDIFFREFGFDTIDIAKGQLKHTDDDWKLYDLKITNENASDFYIDVKNARIADDESKHYTSHCIPKFKKVARANPVSGLTKHVVIAGVISKFQPLEEIRKSPKSVGFLGVTKKAILKSISKVFESGPLNMTFDENELGHTLLPPWVFDFPNVCYARRDKILAEINIEKYSEVRNSPFFLPLVAVKTDRVLNEGRLSDLNFLFFQNLSSRFKKHGIRLPILFGTILEHFVICLNSKITGGFDPKFIRSTLNPFANSRDVTPFFVFDPVDSIKGLINSLSILWQHKNSDLKDVNEFSLRGFSVLKGKRISQESDQWVTLLAYCGGWYEEPLRPCGKTPLVLGECETCSRGYLICPNCGFCCNACKSEQGQPEIPQYEDAAEEQPSTPFKSFYERHGFDIPF